jgi:hypothetical protein
MFLFLIRTHHIMGFELFSALIALRQAGHNLDTSQYAFCLKYVLTSMYAWKENARPQAVEELLLTDIDKAVNNVVMSEMFKTRQIYGYQPVTMTLLVTLWTQHLRPDTDCEYLFVTNAGTKLGQGYVSKAINSYFAHFGLDVSVTVIRKLIEVSFICHYIINHVQFMTNIKK